MRQSLTIGLSTASLFVLLGGVLLAQQAQVPLNALTAQGPGMTAAEDRKRMLELLRLPTTDGPFPPATEDPKRPQFTAQRGRGGTNWYDEAGNTYVRSNWGSWSNYDEAKANPYPLPDPLVLKNGQPVNDADTWWKQRRPEILNDFLTEIYGKIPENTPKVTWEVTGTNPNAANGTAILRTVVGRIDNSAYPAANPSISITMYIPAKAAGPVPLIMVVGGGFGGMGGSGAMSQVLALGWGYATVNTGAIQADSGAGLTSGIIGLVNKGQPRKPDDWGVLAAWSWGLSRALDYLETDKSVDARQVGLEGHSRWGKEALIAMAFDQRFAIVYSSCSGAVGASLEKRDWGETIDNVCGRGEYHWMAGNFLKYGGHWDNMPVDAHELIALCAPRPVFITGGTQDQWSDPHGEFLACVGAGPVYRLLGKKDLGTTEMPVPDVTLDSGEIAFRMHNGGHTDAPNWPAFLKFAQRYLKAPMNDPAGRRGESKVLQDTSLPGKGGPGESGANGSGTFTTGNYLPMLRLYAATHLEGRQKSWKSKIVEQQLIGYYTGPTKDGRD